MSGAGGSAPTGLAPCRQHLLLLCSCLQAETRQMGQRVAGQGACRPHTSLPFTHGAVLCFCVFALEFHF